MFRERTAASSLFKSAGLRSFPLGVALRERPGIRFVSPQEEATTDIESGHDAPSGRFGKLKQNSQTKLTMTDEQIERSIELIKEMLAQREAGEMAKVIE